ncbi:uncharacterized protein LOC123969840 isoform X2 [Micropterus dolomieu]|uniref:uncharacterized protein LOC123969840 isoform X2 n=1 Tax=Micropterus dolomieu TaxID=147949 RepID=UPI001E8D64C3|nr:uncharacterized protein LOC123969840 isoform X2 [Micropterus dolomieu]
MAKRSMGDEADLMSGLSQREKKRSYKDLKKDVEETKKDFNERSTNRLYKADPEPALEPKGLLNSKRQHSDYSGAEAELYGAVSSGFLPAYSVCLPQDRLGIRGVEEDSQDKLLHSCCTAEGSNDQASPNSMLEYCVYLDNQHNMAACPVARTFTPPATPVTHRPCPSIPVPSSVTAIASTMSSVVNPMLSSPMTDTCSPSKSMCSPTGSAWDTLRSTSRSSGCSDRDPVIAAAHLHLLGESLSLIGHHLQETNMGPAMRDNFADDYSSSYWRLFSKMVSVSSSLSLLLDSLLCALAPLICLTSQIPELRSCTQPTLASTLENIAYVMPGM